MAASDASDVLEKTIQVNDELTFTLVVDPETAQQLEDRSTALKYLRNLAVKGQLDMAYITQIDEAMVECNGSEEACVSGELDQSGGDKLKISECPQIAGVVSGAQQIRILDLKWQQPMSWKIQSMDVKKLPHQWSTENTSLLISIIKEFVEQFKKSKKNTVWRKVAQKMKQEGVDVNWEQCNTKWKGLKIMYKKISTHNNTPGKQPKEWEFFDDMDELVCLRPEAQPLATTSSRTSGTSKEHRTPSCSRISPSSPQSTETSSSEEDDASFRAPKRRKAKGKQENKRPSMALRGLAQKQHHENLERTKRAKRLRGMAEKRHQENLERKDRFLSLMEKLIEKL